MDASRASAGGASGVTADPPLPAATPPGPPSTVPSYRRTLANRPFFLLWVAQLVSQSGDFIFEVALLWLVLELTGSPFAVAIIVTGTILPGVILGPFLGVYVDRWDRRRTLVATNVVQGVVIAALSGLVLAGRTDLSVLFAIVLMLGSGATTVRVATNAYVPSVVPVEDLPPANGLLSVSGSMNQIVGLSLGGVFVALFGVTLPIEYDAISFFAAAVLLLLIPAAGTVAEAGGAPASPGFRAEFIEGITFIRRSRFMLELIAIGIVVNFFGNGLFALFAPYADFVLHGGAAAYGFLGASVAAGSVVGAGAMGRVDTRRSAGRYLFAGGISIGVVVLALGLVGSLPIALALMLALGATLAVTNIPITIVLQAKIPGRLLGRVGAAFGALITATAPGGPLFAGWLAQRWSVNGVFLLCGAIFVVVIGLGAITMTSLRRVEY
ncbi:MAG TPA: MFS transporter [Thermoplasmata archaeon]|nr:MFS transporter [Thermoplasmata archaeon]